MKYIIEGFVIANKIIDKELNPQIVPGGCGIYSLSGIKLFEDDCLLVSGIGEDFNDCFGRWFKLNNLLKNGLYIRDRKTLKSEVIYDDNGNYRDIPLSDNNCLIHNQKLIMTIDDIEPFLSDSKGLYLYGDYYFDDIDHIKRLKDKYKFRLMWELSPYSGCNDLEMIKKLINICDIFSLNKKESFAIFSVNNVAEAICKIQELKKPCFYCSGKDGAYFIRENKTTFLPLIKIDKRREVDQTGCGNCSTAAAFWAYCEGKDDLMILCLANTAAGFNTLQYGPIPEFGYKIRNEAYNKALSVYEESR